MTDDDHKHRVLQVQSILHNFKRGTVNEADARMLLEDAGVSPDGVTEMLERHLPKARGITPKVQVSVAIAQAGGIRCPLCRLALLADEPRVLEHMVPRATRIALGQEPDAIDNLAYVHKACADIKTNGTKATSAGSDKHMIAKGVRFDKINRGERSRKRKGPAMKSGPMRSHPTLKRRMDGKVVERG